MRLLIVRHADAGDREEFARTGRPDDERPLSEKGIRQMSEAATLLRALEPDVERIVTSPFRRAMQTAEILRKAWRAAPLTQSETLVPEARPKAFGRLLRELDAEVVICVGHEPHLSTLVAWLTSGEQDGYIDFRKGGACLIEFGEAPEKGGGLLRWLMGPKEMGALR